MIFVPVFYFKDRENYCALQASLCNLGVPSREVPDALTRAIARLYDNQTMGCIHIPHWHQISKDEERTLRNILKVNPITGEPVSQSRKYDVLQYISICMQLLDDDYAAYVQEWCYRQEMCLDEPEDNL